MAAPLGLVDSLGVRSYERSTHSNNVVSRPCNITVAMRGLYRVEHKFPCKEKPP